MSSRATLWCGLIFGGLYLAAFGYLGSPPDADAAGSAVTSWLSEHHGDVRTFAWLLVIGLPFFCASAAGIRQRLPEGLRDLFFAGAVAFVVETALQCWLWGALAFGADSGGSSSVTVFRAALFWGPVLTSATLAMLVPIALGGLRGSWPTWLGVLAAVTALEQAVETSTLFGHHGSMAPGGGMNVYLGAGLTAAALIGTVVCVALGRAAAPGAADG